MVFLLCVVGYAFFFKHIQTLNGELREAKKELVTLDIREENKIETVSLLANTEEERKELQTYLVSIEDPTPFLENIEQLANDTGVTLEVQSLRPEDVKEAVLETQKVMVVKLFVEGRWTQLYRLISLLETMPHLTTIEKVTLTLKDDDNAQEWEGVITLRSIAI